MVRAVVFLALYHDVLGACTTFCLHHEGNVLVGKNYDWEISYGHAMINPSGMTKTAMADPGVRSLRWTAIFRSVTFNQYGFGFPSGGMNEAGLVIELMWLDETVYPPAHDPRPALNCLQWIQYHLDLCRDVPELLRRLDSVRIQSHARLHYLAVDAAGRTAAIEFLDGNTVISTGETMIAPVLTNHTYAASTAYLRRHRGFGGSQELRAGAGSLDRFCTAAARVRDYAGKQPAIEYGFRVLNDVKQPMSTQWSIVYDVAARTVYWTTRNNSVQRILSLHSARNLVAWIDIDSSSGNVNEKLRPYSESANRDLVTRSYRHTSFLASTDEGELHRVATFPRSWK